jgi:hypothetical protein
MNYYIIIVHIHRIIIFVTFVKKNLTINIYDFNDIEMKPLNPTKVNKTINRFEFVGSKLTRYLIYINELQLELEFYKKSYYRNIDKLFSLNIFCFLNAIINVQKP